MEEHEEINPTGTGLGLSICKKIIDQMGCQIDVESTLDVGTTFSVVICTDVRLQGQKEAYASMNCDLSKSSCLEPINTLEHAIYSVRVPSSLNSQTK